MPAEVLQKFWGYPGFRDKQEEIIRSILSKRDTLALLPTGGGKSICYQVPALMLDGVCMVVSPLIALMRDQVAQLKNRGISATYLYGGQSKKEIDVELQNIRNNKYRLVYVSPERLQTKSFIENIKRTQVSFLAVDEAHCISQWGHDFRPEFRQIANIREVIPDVTILALTASATTTVVDDIVSQLGLSKPAIIRKSFYRENLTYNVQYDENKRQSLIHLAKSIPGTGVVYTRTRRRTIEISNLLKSNGIRSDYYHGGLTNQERNIKQDRWTQNESSVMVATNAFGMGIDKPDVRFVAHYDMPDSLEAYYQEAGRAGRDGKASTCVLFYDEGDILQLRSFVNNQFPTMDRVQQVYNGICNYFELAFHTGLEARFDFDLVDFCNKFELPAIEVYAAIKVLQKLGYIHMSEGFYRPSKLKIDISSTVLYDFQLKNVGMDKLIKTILRSYAGVYDFYTIVNENQLAQRSQLPVSQVVSKLKTLNELKVLTYQPASEKPFLTFLQPRVQEIKDPEGIVKENKERTLSRLEAMTGYVEGETCRSTLICDYFGEDQPKHCGVCDVCLLKTKLKMGRTEFRDIECHIEKLLHSQPMLIEDVMRASEEYDHDAILDVLRLLISDNKVITDKSGYLRFVK